MYAKWKLAAGSVAAAAVTIVVVACSASKDSSSNALPSAAAVDFEAAIQGHPNQSATAAGAALSAALSASELEHLVNTDWNALDHGGVLHDPVFAKAFDAIAPIADRASQSAIGARSVGVTPHTVLHAQDCPAPDCAMCASQLDAAIETSVAKVGQDLPKIAFTCAAVSLATSGGIAAPIICGAALVFWFRSTSTLIDQLGCRIATQDLSQNGSSTQALIDNCSKPPVDAGADSAEDAQADSGDDAGDGGATILMTAPCSLSYDHQGTPRAYARLAVPGATGAALAATVTASIPTAGVYPPGVSDIHLDVYAGSEFVAVENCSGSTVTFALPADLLDGGVPALPTTACSLSYDHQGTPRAYARLAFPGATGAALAAAVTASIPTAGVYPPGVSDIRLDVFAGSGFVAAENCSGSTVTFANRLH